MNHLDSSAALCVLANSAFTPLFFTEEDKRRERGEESGVGLGEGLSEIIKGPAVPSTYLTPHNGSSPKLLLREEGTKRRATKVTAAR